MRPDATDLPLLSRTPDAWAVAALREPEALLGDHAYLEKKAAANALELLNRWPEPVPPKNWITILAGIARDETNHLASVCRLLHRRGGRLEKLHRNPYANALRDLVRKGQGKRELVDRLLVSALIEARSCERFEVLARIAEDADLRKLYAGLESSERNHFRLFLRLAATVLEKDVVAQRWNDWLQAEAAILAVQEPGPRMHAGPPS